MKRKSVIIFLIIALIIIMILFVFLYMMGRRNGEPPDREKGQEEAGKGTNDTTVDNGEQEGTGGSGGVSIGGTGTGGTGGSGENGGNGITLPSDIDTRPCGFYVSEYNVCAGVCPSGTCQQEGNSCYCKM